MTTFGPIFAPEALREAVSDGAWLAAMLEAEQALARASARAGVVPAEAAAAIAALCVPERFDLHALVAEGHAVGNPAQPLVRALRAQAGAEAEWVHFGATSQDVVDTAAMLVARRATALVRAELDGVGAAAARMAEEHRETPLAARTLLQQAVPTTFGATAAGWLDAVVEARERLDSLRWPAQLGGAAGTLAAFGDHAAAVVDAFAAELGLDAPRIPWHASRAPLGRLGGALDEAAQACAKIGLDVVLLAQSELGEVAEGDGGASSTMPHKRNPARAVLARACARVCGNAVALLGSGEHELARAAGAWQAEWTALSEALAHAGGAAAAARECLEGLEVFPERMRENMRPELFSERDRLGLDDQEYVGATGMFVDRALAHWRESG